MRIVAPLVTVLLLCACGRTAVTADTSTGVSPSASGKVAVVAG
jgi:hypothetical protein